MDESSSSGLEPPADDADRISDFFARHGGPGRAARHGESSGGLEGWSEIGAADGCILRCDWSRLGTVEEIKYSEIPAAQPG
jgi:hypothetical protein